MSATERVVASPQHLRMSAERSTVPHPTITSGDKPMKKTFHAPRLVEETTLAELTLLPVVSDLPPG
jgi:hypothetical protein